MLPKEKKNSFLIKNPENGNFNQYWYSPKTIQFMVSQIKSQKASKIAFLSTPSIYYSLDDEELKKTSKLFEVFLQPITFYEYFFFQFDTKFSKDPNFIFYDFAHPENLGKELEGVFDFLIIDPPFITRDVWTKALIFSKILKTKNFTFFCYSMQKLLNISAQKMTKERLLVLFY